jgi:hypothetical protein
MKYFSWISVTFDLKLNYKARIDQEYSFWIHSNRVFLTIADLYTMINLIEAKGSKKLEFISIKFYVQLVKSSFFISLKPTDT